MSQTPEEIALARIRQAAESGAEELDLSHLELTSLPEAIGQLIKLKKLSLEYCSLEKLPSDIGKLQNLKELHLKYNQLISLPPEICQLENLEKFDLSENELTSLPAEILRLQKLRVFDLTENKLTSLPSELWELSALKEIYISYNPLSEIPHGLWHKHYWEGLGLGELFTEFPLEVLQCVQLRKLFIQSNKLTKLPPEIGGLTNLITLDLYNNQLTSLPPQIGKLVNLITLRVSKNQLSSVPFEITKLNKLEKLYFSRNKLVSLPLEIAQLQNLIELDISNNQLPNLPPEIGLLTNLTELDVSYNSLETLPPQIGQLTKLNRFSSHSCELTSLPPEIGKLGGLKFLFLFNNDLKKIPTEIGQLKNLTDIYLMNNMIKELPSEVGNLINLDSLHLSSNQLKKIPEEITQLQNLRILDLSANQFTFFPLEVTKLKNLKILGFFQNKLTHLPHEVSSWDSLEKIDIRDNPLEIALPYSLRGDAYNGSIAKNVFSYYKQMHKEGGCPLGEARVLVVGEADAGKTKLLRALLHGEHGAAFKDARDPTDGIEVNLNETDDIKLRYWDFGGQELYHATHRFFLSRRCVYILVADATKDSNYNEEKIEYWLELLKFFGGDSPVILVASKVENYSLNVNERRLQDKYSNLVKMPALRTSAKTGTGIEDLRHIILEQVKSLPSVSVMLPRSFLAVKDALEKIKSNKQVKVIEDTVYRRLCEENGITEEERKNTLLALLHDMGVVLHYEDDRLSDFGILNPDWATGGVYKVVNSPQIEKSQGRFTLAELKSILADEELYPASMRRRIVDLMKKFELTFELPFERDAYVLPSALPRKQPELSGWDVSSMTFEYRYTLLQISILHRFIVAEHDLIQNGLVWYSGVVIARGDNQVLVIADTRDKRITIKIKGAEESSKEFLYSIRLQFERIHGEEAKPEEYVYSPQHPELSLLFVDMKTMAKTEREYKVVHKGKMVNINLRELLDGFITSEERRKDEEREKQEGKRGDTYITNNISLGSMEGSSLVIGDNNTSNVNVQNSFNTFPAELQNTLVELINSCETLLQKVESSEHTEEIRDELETLQNEAKKSKPKKERVKFTVEGLAQAAKNLNDIGKPVLELAMTVIKLINTLPA